MLSTVSAGLGRIGRVIGRPVCFLLLGAAVSGCAGSISRDTYAGLASNLQASGKLRTDPAPADAPFGAEDLIRTFRDIAFSYEFHFRDGKIVNERLSKPLHRWRGQIRYKLQGDAITQADAREVADLTARLRALTGLEFVQTEGKHDMLITIATKTGQAQLSAEFERREMPVYKERYDLWRQTPTWICGATLSHYTDGSNRLAYAHIFMGAELTGILRTACLHEEIVQSLGLMNDSDAARPSIFNDDQEFATLTDHDALLLSVLYDPALDSGMAEDEAMPIVRRLVRERLAAQ